MRVNLKRMEKLSLVTQIDKTFFISIVIVNDNCVIKKEPDNIKGRNFLVHKKDVKKLIKQIESRNVKKMDPEQLQYAVQDIARLYGQANRD